MKKRTLIPAAVLGILAPIGASAAPLYWDLTAGVAGAGGPTPSGTFNSNSWNTVSDGTGALGAITSADTAIFSAGTDATGAFTVNLTAATTVAGVTVEEGTVSLTGSALTIGAGTLSIASGGTFSIASSANLVATTGANLNLNGGTIRNTSNAAGATFADIDFTINVGAAGGTVEATNTGTASAIFQGSINGPGNVLTKTGSGEFRFQGANTATTTFSKLVVNQGLFRLGHVTGADFETGFGAVPTSFTPDAITLSGGGLIGTSYAVTLDLNRGITLGIGGGGVNAGSGSMTIPAAIAGTTGFLVTAGTVTLNGTISAQTLTIGGTLNANGVIGGTGPLVKSGAGILTLAAANTFTGDINFTDGRINFNHNNAASSATIVVGANADEFTNSANGIVLANNITLSAGANPKIYSTSGNSLNLTGIISGSGSLLRDDTGAGVLTFSGANTYSGGFKITSRGISIGNKAGFGTGTLTIGDATTVPANPISITATTDLSGANAVANPIVLNRDFTTAGSNLEFSSSIDLGATTRIITAGNTAGSATILSGGISGVGGGLTKAGTGTLILAGAGSFTGPTTVNAGTLLVSGNLTGTSQVAVSGTLGGTGTIAPASGGNVNVLAGGILSPGASIGTLTVNLSGGGALDISAGVGASNSQSLAFELATPGSSDKITLSGGALTIGTGVLEFNDFNFSTQVGFVPFTDYVLFDGSVPITGSLGAVLTGTIGTFDAEIQLADGGNDLVLHVVPEPSAALAILGGAATLIGLRRRRS
jgi:autotransporter-associated beta strand protein